MSADKRYSPSDIDARSNSPRKRSRSRSPIGKGDKRAFGDDTKILLTNLCFSMAWKDIKDWVKQETGLDCFVNTLEDDNGKFKGIAYCEFRTPEAAETAIEKLNQKEIKGRRIIARRETWKDKRRNEDEEIRKRQRSADVALHSLARANISMDVLQRLDIDPSTVCNKVFVSQLDYKVTQAKLQEIFRLAGTVRRVDLKKDSDGKSRGQAVVEFDTPVEAIQAISMFNGQILFDRVMSVRMDKGPMSKLAGGAHGIGGYSGDSQRLPSGLRSIGVGLSHLTAPNGMPSAPMNSFGGFAPKVNIGGDYGNADMLQSLMGSNTFRPGGLIGGPVEDRTFGSSGHLERPGMPGLSVSGPPGLGVGMAGPGPAGSQISQDQILAAAQTLVQALQGNALGAGVAAGLAAQLSSLTKGGPIRSVDLDQRGCFPGPPAVAPHSFDFMPSLGGHAAVGLNGSQSAASSIGPFDGYGVLERTMAPPMDFKGTIGNLATTPSPMLPTATTTMRSANVTVPLTSNMGRNLPPSRSGAASNDMREVIVKNLPYSVDWRKLKERFMSVGKVGFVDMLMENGRSTGKARVRFDSPEDARRAIDVLNGAMFEGRPMGVYAV